MNKLVSAFLILVIIGNSSAIKAQVLSQSSVYNTSSSAILENKAGKWTFQIFPNNIIKVNFLAEKSVKNEQVSDAVIMNPIKNAPVIIKTNNENSISWNDENNNNSRIIINDSGIIFIPTSYCKVTLTNSFYSADLRGFNFKLASNEMIFGGGERSLPLNRRGYRLPLNNNPWYGYTLNADALNFSVPFILSNNNYALFFDNPSKGYLDIGKAVTNDLEYRVMSGELSFYIIPGKDYNEIMYNYHQLVGTQPLPPRWAMGNLMSRFGYTSEKQATEIISKMRKDSVPLDAIIFDLFWFGDSIKNTLGNLEWVNKKAWPDPKKMMANFKTNHVKTILIAEPFVVNTSFNFESSKKYHAVDSLGSPFLLTDFYFGHGGLIDIFRKDAQQWFYSKYKKQMDNGVNGWWGDLGEPEKHPEGIYHNLQDFGFSRKFAADEVHNIYGHYWSKMLFENFKKSFPNKRLFHLNRSGYAGSPRYCSYPWTGDVSRSWDGLKAQLPVLQGMSISGVPYVHSDAGGFAGGDGDPELYVRWLQFAAFTPIYRPHGTALGNIDPNAKDIPSEASLWPEPIKSLAKEAAITRYRWLPYNYNLSYLQTKNGKPLIMPMFFLDASDSNLYKATDQYLWGDNIMIVPITDKGQSIKTYYIPEEKWTNLNTMKVYSGSRWITDSSINMNAIPVYAKEGSFIPNLAAIQYTEDYNNKTLIVNYIPSVNASEYNLYEDDGEDASSIINKKFEITSFKCSGIKHQTIISIGSNGGKYIGQQIKRKILLNIPNFNQNVRVFVSEKEINQKLIVRKNNGISIPLEFNHTTLNIKLTSE